VLADINTPEDEVELFSSKIHSERSTKLIKLIADLEWSTAVLCVEDCQVWLMLARSSPTEET